MDKEQRFYFEGVFYKDQESFFKAQETYANSALSPVSFERMWKQLGETVDLNFFNLHRYEKITNADAKGVLECILYETLNEFKEKIRDKDG